jgi:hypothetical protein
MHSAKRYPRKLFALELACSLIALSSYWLLWGSIDGFVRAIDEVPGLFYDFSNYYYAMGDVLLSTQSPIEGYYYSAFFASLLSVFTLLPETVALGVWVGLQIIMAIWFYVVSADYLLGYNLRKRALYLLLFFTSLPLLHNFKYGQVSTFIALGIVLCFIYQNQGRSTTAGLVLALVTSIKYYPGVFVLYFIIQRDVRFLKYFFLGLIVFYIAIPLLQLGMDGWIHFTTVSFSQFPTYRLFYGSPGSQNFIHVLLRWSYNLDYNMTEMTYHLLRYFCIVLFVLHFALAEWLRRYTSRDSTALPLATLLLALPFVLPTSWPHYFIYLPLCQMAIALFVVKWAAGSWFRQLSWLLLILSITSSSIYLFNAFPNWTLYYNTGVLAFANLFLLAILYGIAFSLFSKHAPANAQNSVQKNSDCDDA